MARVPGCKVTACVSFTPTLPSHVARLNARLDPVPLDRHFDKIQDHPESFYRQFNLVITGLDSVEARRWMNATLVGMVDEDEGEETLKPLIDGGTEGASRHLSFACARRADETIPDDSRRLQGPGAGHSADHHALLRVHGASLRPPSPTRHAADRAFLASLQLHMHTPPTAFPICTIANTPRLPEHCIEWASVLEWPRVFKGASPSR